MVATTKPPRATTADGTSLPNRWRLISALLIQSRMNIGERKRVGRIGNPSLRSRPEDHLKLVEPEMEAAVVGLWLPPLIPPVRFAEWRVGHVSRRWQGWRAWRLGPLRSHHGPIV